MRGGYLPSPLFKKGYVMSKEKTTCCICGKSIEIPTHRSAEYGDTCDNYCDICWNGIEFYAIRLEEVYTNYIQKHYELRKTQP